MPKQIVLTDDFAIDVTLITLHTHRRSRGKRVCESCQNPIKMRAFCSMCNELVKYKTIYLNADRETLTEQDIKNKKWAQQNPADILVSRPIPFSDFAEKFPQYVLPAGAYILKPRESGLPYSALREYLAARNYVLPAVFRYSQNSIERICYIAPFQRYLILYVMYFDHEVIDFTNLEIAEIDASEQAIAVIGEIFDSYDEYMIKTSDLFEDLALIEPPKRREVLRKQTANNKFQALINQSKINKVKKKQKKEELKCDVK